MSKNIWCIRHGTALHNTLFRLIGKKAYTDKIYTDTPLVETGEIESRTLGNTWRDIHKIDVVFVSPSKRTLQTATNIFKNTTKKLIAIDEITEYPQSVEYCNKRKNKTQLKKLYPSVDFSNLNEISPYWIDDTDVKESEKECLERAKKFKEFLMSRPEKNICIVTHSSFLKGFMFGKLQDLEQELHHCYPYKFSL
jgi:broad specificity phosphatase PhoE